MSVFRVENFTDELLLRYVYAPNSKPFEIEVRDELRKRLLSNFEQSGWRWKFKEGQGPQRWNYTIEEPVRHCDWDVEEVYTKKKGTV